MQTITDAHSNSLFTKQSKAGWWLLRKVNRENAGTEVIFFIWTAFVFSDSHAQSNSLANESIGWEWITCAYGWQNQSVPIAISGLQSSHLIKWYFVIVVWNTCRSLESFRNHPFAKCTWTLVIIRHEHNCVCVTQKWNIISLNQKSLTAVLKYVLLKWNCFLSWNSQELVICHLNGFRSIINFDTRIVIPLQKDKSFPTMQMGHHSERM